MEKPCDILQLQDKKTYFIHFRPLSQLAPAGMLCGNPRHALSFLSLVQGRSDGCGVFTEEVLHGTWMPPEAIGDISFENPVLQSETSGLLCAVYAHGKMWFPCMSCARVVTEAVGRRSRGKHSGSRSVVPTYLKAAVGPWALCTFRNPRKTMRTPFKGNLLNFNFIFQCSLSSTYKYKLLNRGRQHITTKISQTRWKR